MSPNTEKKRAYIAEWKRRNPTKFKAYADKHRATEKGQIGRRYHMYKRAARERGVVWDLSKQDFAAFWKEPCCYCGHPIFTIGLDRIDNDLGYTLENVVPACKRCNVAKNDLPVGEFLSHCTRILSHILSHKGSH